MTCTLNNISATAYFYGFMMTLAFVTGLSLLWFNLRRTGIDRSIFIDLALITVFSSVVGARILYILLYPHQFNSLYDYLALHEGGLVFFGGFIGAISALLAFAYLKKMPAMRLLDSLAPSIAIGHAIGRIGCFTNHCCYGIKTDLFHFYHLPADPEKDFRHPTQLYESAFLLILAVFLQLRLKKTYSSTRPISGFIATIYLSSYTFFRFLIEFIRGDDRGGSFTPLGLSISQILSLTIFIATAFAAKRIYYEHKKSGKNLNE
jgi:phosphatidylglycerol:prolipoprotein diacylglycerol transferase